MIPSPTGDTLFISVERNRSRGPVEDDVIGQLDLLRPHLARSALMSARLHLERARIASETLAIIGLPALVFDDHGKILAANHLIEALGDHITWRAHGGLALNDGVANRMLRQAIETLNSDDAAPTRSFAVRGREDSALMVAHVVPIRPLGP